MGGARSGAGSRALADAVVGDGAAGVFVAEVLVEAAPDADAAAGAFAAVADPEDPAAEEGAAFAGAAASHLQVVVNVTDLA